MMEFCAPSCSSLADSSILHYDAVQLNRIEWMLMQLMTKLSVCIVPDLSVSGPLATDVDEEGGVTKSKQRRMRENQTKRRMWQRLQEEGGRRSVVSEQSADKCELTENMDGSISMVRSMFQKVVAMETKVDGISAVAEEANFIACQASSKALAVTAKASAVDDVISGPSSELPTDGCDLSEDVHAGVDGHSEVEAVGEELGEVDAAQKEADIHFLQGLRGTHKQDAVLNIIINRACSVNGIGSVLNDIEKYFDNDVGRVASFFGMKFGFRVRDWSDCCDQIVSTAVAMNLDPNVKTSVGGVLAHIRREQSAPASGQQDRLRERANEVVRPRCRKKKQK